MPLIKDLIDIPRQVNKGDFVLNLTDGLQADAAERTLRDYVVTDQLARCFVDALNFVGSAVDSGQTRSKGAYLHGSFGSGKSHFMAVLHLLLQGHSSARAIPELAPAIAENSSWLGQKKTLLVPYHMIGAASMEAGVLGGYWDHVRSLHPDAPVPGFYLSDQLFEDAVRLRKDMGDEAFFARLNEGNAGAGADDWGDLSVAWDATSFERVVAGQADDEAKADLVSALVGSLFTAFRSMASTTDGGYVDFDEGLAVITRHARALGYDAVILFLDELILWLASHLSDHSFTNREIQKVVKLVDTGTPRAVPLVSFIARQRDLREFIGDTFTGAEEVALGDQLKHWEGRFHTITLEDRNLPVIAERRLLRPKDDAAKSAIDSAFANTAKIREDVLNDLLTSTGDKEMFRRLYPFSPALMQALVALSATLQRERTALKVMLHLLVSQRDTLELGKVIPVGDLYDVIAEEAAPFSDKLRQDFDNAKALFERKLVPMLEAQHNLDASRLHELPADDTSRAAFTADVRLLKTLVLAALVPEVECFRNLTASRLAALNHGTIRSPIPGREAGTVLNKCNTWASQVGELKISEEASATNPTISIQLSGVDIDGIVANARITDNDGNRQRLVKDLLHEALGIEDADALFIQHKFQWRGTARTAEVMFQNVREITEDAVFANDGDQWRVILDYPFDTGDHTPADDQARIRGFEERDGQGRTICWLPHFFTDGVMRSLGTLVVLREILKSQDSYQGYSAHLTPQDRAAARPLLENQRDQLHQRIRDCLMAAYGVDTKHNDVLVHQDILDSQVISLQPGFDPRLPIGATLKEAFLQLLDQALRSQYPGHPEFENPVRTTDLGKVLQEVRRAIPVEDHRIEVERPQRPLMRQIAAPLELGAMHERHFIYEPVWRRRFEKYISEQELAEVTVADLRRAMDADKPRGLPQPVQNLLVLVYAEEGHFSFTLHGATVPAPGLSDLRDEYLLVKADLAAPAEWGSAIEMAGHLFGLSLGTVRNATNQQRLQEAVQQEARDLLQPNQNLVAALDAHMPLLGLGSDTDRQRTAAAAVALLQALKGAQGPALVQTLAAVEPPTTKHALAKSMSTAVTVSQALQDFNWPLVNAAFAKGKDGDALRVLLAKALAADELVMPVRQELNKAQGAATALLATPVEPPPHPPEPAPAAPLPARSLAPTGKRQGVPAGEARELLKSLATEVTDGAVLDISWRVVQPDDN